MGKIQTRNTTPNKAAESRRQEALRRAQQQKLEAQKAAEEKRKAQQENDKNVTQKDKVTLSGNAKALVAGAGVGVVAGATLGKTPSTSTVSSKDSQGFTYEPLDPKDLTEAQGWKPGKDGLTPAQANQQINDDYHKLNQGMQDYMQGDKSKEKLPTIPDWMSFGKYASREAGTQIRNLENMQKARNGDLEAVSDLARDGMDWDAIRQGGSMFGGSVERTSKEGPNPFIAGVGLQNSKQTDLLGATGDMDKKLDKLSTALVKGNTEIHKSIAPAYDAFLKGESQGGKGLETLEKNGYKPGSEKDPQGFITNAFKSYKEARELGVQAQNTTDPKAKAELLEQRRKLMEKGNLMLGIQEQQEILQQKEVYGDKDVQDALKSVRGQMSITDPNGKHSVGSVDKDWTNFGERMGLKPVSADTKDAIPVRDKDGKTTYYVPDPTQKGTIVEYFSRYSKGDEEAQQLTRNLNENKARPVESTPETTVGVVVDQAGKQAEQLKQRALKAYEWVAQTPGSIYNMVA